MCHRPGMRAPHLRWSVRLRVGVGLAAALVILCVAWLWMMAAATRDDDRDLLAPFHFPPGGQAYGADLIHSGDYDGAIRVASEFAPAPGRPRDEYAAIFLAKAYALKGRRILRAIVRRDPPYRGQSVMEPSSLAARYLAGFSAEIDGYP